MSAAAVADGDDMAEVIEPFDVQHPMIDGKRVKSAVLVDDGSFSFKLTFEDDSTETMAAADAGLKGAKAMISEELSAPRPRVAVTISASVSKLNKLGAPALERAGKRCCGRRLRSKSSAMKHAPHRCHHPQDLPYPRPRCSSSFRYVGKVPIGRCSHHVSSFNGGSSFQFTPLRR